jgi:hypothetical protein
MTQALNLIQKASASFQSVPVESFRRIWSTVVDVSTVKFQLPLDGAIFDDNLKGLPSQINLPYETIVLELRRTQRDRIARGIIILVETVEENSIRISAIAEASNGYWTVNTIVTILPKSNISVSMLDNLNNVIIAPEYNRRLVPDLVALERDIQKLSVRIVLELVEALSCSNVYIDTLSVSTKFNKQRASQGKLPLYEYKILTIDAPTEHSSNRVPLGGTHRSPRQHLRRGHVRIYNRGTPSEYKVWVNSMVINRKNPSKIEKMYDVGVR